MSAKKLPTQKPSPIQRILSSLIVIGTVFSVQAGAEPMVAGQVRLASGEPVAGAQVRMFDLIGLYRFVGTTTDETGHFALPLRVFSTARSAALPTDFALGQNYPNPFNPSTIIPYQLPTSAHVRLEVFNLLGQRLATLVDAEQAAGIHTAQWDATDAAGRAVGAGVYIYRLSSGEMTESRRMVLVDGQAGIPAVGAAPVSVRSAGEGAVEADGSVYGLTVSGAGLVAYVNPTFRVGVDEVDIVIEEHSSARMKRAVGGVLGDVDGNGQVDVFDVLYVLLYSVDSSIVLPNNGDISRGDVNGDGLVDVSDAVLLLRYLSNPSDPALPPGIGQDPDDTLAGATPVDLGSSTDGSLSEGDTDYFRVEMSSAGTLTAYTTGHVDTEGAILDSSGTVLARDSDSGERFNFRVSVPVDAGTYYIEVKGWRSSTTGDYTLDVQVQVQVQDPDDTLAGATPVDLGSSTDGSLSEGDTDYFRVEMSSAGTLTAYTTGRVDTEGAILDSSGTVLARDSDSGERFNFRVSVPVDAGTYYIEVEGWRSSTTGDYTLDVQVQVQDPDDTLAGATPVDLGSYIVTRLTHDSAFDGYPAWSPDGQRIAFHSERDFDMDVYVMAADGSNPTGLANYSAFDGYPAWSPDGQRIAFHSNSNRNRNTEVYVMAADGSNPTRLTRDSAFDGYPAWSPDGQRIAFHSERDGNAEVYVMAADGSNLTRLTHDSAFDGYPAWSPDGQRIAFHSGRDGNAEVYVMAADGGNPTRLTHRYAFDGYPAWSPDGQRIAFQSERDFDMEIYVMAAYGSTPTRLTDDSAFDGAPAWSPDGQRIAFQSNRDGNFEIYLIIDTGDSEIPFSASVSPFSPFASVTAGEFHTCGVKTDGTVACWGLNYWGQATPPVGTFTSVSAGGLHTCGVKTDGSVTCWGANEDSEGNFVGQATPPVGTFASVSAGGLHTCGVKTDGSVTCWGLNEDREGNFTGQATPPAGTFLSVSAGLVHTCGVKTNGSVVCWGYNEFGQATPPAGTFASVSAGGLSTCGVKTDNSVVCWGFQAASGGTFLSVSAGLTHACGVKTDGSVTCWGSNEDSEGNFAGQATPPFGTFASVSAGGLHTCGVKTDNSVVCWGDDRVGQSNPPGPAAKANKLWDKPLEAVLTFPWLRYGSDPRQR